MKKYEKEVQQAFLNNEEAVIKRLKSVYNQSLKDITAKSNALQNDIEKLAAMYDDIEDEAEKAQLQSMMRSKVYQKQYQEGLKKQVSDILDNMYENEYKTVSDYLVGCYDEGFLGAMYSLQQQGVPLAFPIDQTQLVKAVQLDSKISQGLYSRLGEDVSLLKRKITAQVSRGISTGMTYAQVAQQLAGYTNIGFNNAVRIARTEGHRIQCQAGMDACYKAKEKGADVLKQWDSTMDSATRESHVAVDGEIRELDEPFSNGLMFAGDPSGGAAEVVNCRCALLQRARWALDEDELQTLKDRAEFFGIDKNDSFEDFKKKYLKRAEQESAVTEIKDALDFGYGDFTDDDFVKWIDDYDKHNSSVHLSADELKVIDDYTEGGYIALNDVCRYSDAELLKRGYSVEDIARNRKRAEMLDDSLSKYDLDTDIVTHRFERDVSWLTGKGNNIEDLEALIGKEYTAKGFSSSGMLPNRFRFTGGKKDAVHFEIVTPKGTKGAYLSMSKKGEQEFLYNRKTRFKILDGGERVVKERKLNIRTMQMDEIDVTERFLKVQVIIDDVADTVDDIHDVAKVVSVKKPVFTPAKTLDDAEKHIKKYVNDNEWAGTGVSYKGVSVETANKVNETLTDLYETFDVDRLGGVYVAKGNTKLGKAVDGATAAYSPVRKSLILNNRAMKNVDDIAISHAKEVELIQGYAKNPSAYTFKSKKAEEIAKASIKSGRATVPETVDDVIHHEMGHHIEGAVKKANGYDAVLSNMPQYAENISGYATISESEYIAESFASYLKGEGLIDPELAKIFDSMKR